MAEFEQLQLDGMEKFQIPDGWLPTVTTEVTDRLRLKGYLVSAVGQLTIPASARERWGLREGGTVNVFDIGEAVFVFSEQIDPDTARELIHQATSPVHQELPPQKTARSLSVRGILNNVLDQYE